MQDEDFLLDAMILEDYVSRCDMIMVIIYIRSVTLS